METSIAVGPRPAGVKAMQSMPPRSWPNDAGIKTNAEERQAFDAQDFLDTAGVAKKVVNYGGKEIVFTLGDPATSVFYIQKGSVKLTVVNETGNEAVVAISGPGEFFGVKCLAGQPRRVMTAETIIPTIVLVIQKHEMIRVLRKDHAFSDRFIAYMLTRNIREEESLIDQLFNSSEKRLARVLLLLAHYGKQVHPERVLPKVSQEVLAEMVGTTRSRVNHLMNKFRNLGFIEYGGKTRGLEVNQSLLSAVLKD